MAQSNLVIRHPFSTQDSHSQTIDIMLNEKAPIRDAPLPPATALDPPGGGVALNFVTPKTATDPVSAGEVNTPQYRKDEADHAVGSPHQPDLSGEVDPNAVKYMGFTGDRLIWAVTFFATIGFSLFGYDQGLMSGIIVSILSAWSPLVSRTDSIVPAKRALSPFGIGLATIQCRVPCHPSGEQLGCVPRYHSGYDHCFVRSGRLFRSNLCAVLWRKVGKENDDVSYIQSSQADDFAAD